MGSIKDIIAEAGFFVAGTVHPPVPEDIPTYRSNDAKLIGEGIYIPVHVREELGLRLS